MEFEQLSIFDYLSPPADFPHLVADGLIEHCRKWGYDYMEKLQERGGNQFYNIFCRITNVYYIRKTPEEYYSVEFLKDGKAVIKRCGIDFHKREADTVIDIQSIVDILIKKW